MKDLKKMTIEQLKSYKESIQEVRTANYGVLNRQQNVITEIKMQLFNSLLRIQKVDDEIEKREQESTKNNSKG